MMDLLLEHPEWLEKCINEIQSFDQDINFESLQKLPVVEACLYEAMRLYPAGWGFTREAANDDEMLGEVVKKGDIFLVSPFLTQHSELYWDNPEEFRQKDFGKKMTDEMRQIYFPFKMAKNV